MKKILFAFIAGIALCTSIACGSDDDLDTNEGNQAEASIIGRWSSVGFEDAVLYQFTSDKRYTMYADSSGIFPTLEEYQEQNPDLPGNDWEYSGDTVVVDLNFGNYSRQIPDFKCDNYVIDWIRDDGEEGSRYFRDGYDVTECD